MATWWSYSPIVPKNGFMALFDCIYFAGRIEKNDDDYPPHLIAVAARKLKMSDPSREKPGPPPRRHLTADGKWFLLYVAVGIALLAFTLFMCVPSRFGFSPG
jgi:hypothetical protein